MNVPDLLAELQGRHIVLFPEGDRIRYRGPRGAMTPDLLERLRRSKAELLEALRSGEDHESGLLQGSEVRQEKRMVAGWLFYSRLFDREFWLAKDEPTAERLAAEHPGVPVITIAEVAILETKPPELLRAILETKAVFPDAGVRE